MTKKQLTILLAVITLLLGIVSMLVLPNEIAVQWDFSGEVQNTLPTVAAVLISFGITAICLLYAWAKENKWYSLLGGIGIVMQIVFLIMNLH